MMRRQNQYYNSLSNDQCILQTHDFQYLLQNWELSK